MTNRQAWLNRLCAAALVAGATCTQALAADPVLSLSPSSNPVLLGNGVTVSVQLSDVTDLYGWQFSLNFNPAVVQVTAVSEGSFLSGGGTTFFSGGTVNNTTGSISFAFDSLVGDLPGVTGSGTLATISFSTSATGTSALSFGDVLLLNSQLGQIAAQSVGASLVVTAVPEPATALLLALGLLGVARARSSRREAAEA